MSDLHRLLERSAALHNHLCPRQVLGVRIGMYAAEVLRLDLPQSDKRVYAFVETDGCFADGVAVASGCWLGRRTMRLIDYGKVAATFVDTHTDRAVRIWPQPLARARAAHYAPGSSSDWQAQLEGYQRMPAAELLSACEVDLTVHLAAIISRPGVRVNCSVCGEEILNERELLLGGAAVCQSCAGDSYWRRTPKDGQPA